MFKYSGVPLAALLLACGVVACGAGPEGGGPLGLTADEQHIPVNDGQRIPPSDPQIPTTDPQAVVTNDPQAVPPSGGGPAINIGPGDEGCEDYCSEYDEGKCGQQACRALCPALRVAPGPCAQTLLQGVRCLAGSGDNCEQAQQSCLGDFEARLQASCGGEFTASLMNGDQN